MDGLTDWLEKQSKRRQQVGKRNNQQNELVQLIKQEAHSVKHYQQSQQVGLAADMWASSGSGVRGKHLATAWATESMSGLSCLVSVPRPAPRCLGVWLMRLSAASIAPLHHPSLLDGPVMPAQREGRAAIDMCLQDGVITELTQEKFLWWGGMIPHSCYGL